MPLADYVVNILKVNEYSVFVEMRSSIVQVELWQTISPVDGVPSLLRLTIEYVKEQYVGETLGGNSVYAPISDAPIAKLTFVTKLGF